MSLTVTKSFNRPLREIVEIPRAALQDIGDFAITRIRQRTERGIDVDGQAFAPLSPAYARAKQDAGLRPDADLTVSGRMLNDMRATVPEAGVVEIAFVSRGGRATGRTFIQRSRAVGAADKAFFHNEAGAGRSRVIRKFFDLSDEDMAVIYERVGRALDAQL